MNIKGKINYGQIDGGGGYSAEGAFYVDGTNQAGFGNNRFAIPRFSFDASRNWTGSTSSSGNHKHTITSTLTKSSIYGNNETVQPPSIGLKVKTRYK